MRRFLTAFLVFFGAYASADVIHPVVYNTLEIPITPFSNMASGYQATNPGFRAILRSESGHLIAGGPLTIDAVIAGRRDDATQGSAYGRLILKLDVVDGYPGVSSGVMSGTYKGTLSICMARNPEAPMADTECLNLKGNIHPERPFQWINKPVDFVVQDGNIEITKYYGNVGEGGTSKQLSLAVFHPAYGFAAPGKAFKDYQSPLVLDLDHNGKIDLVNVWADLPIVRFDLTGEGKKLRTGWVKGQDGFLFLDNGSGCVTDGRQFFGEFTNSLEGDRTFHNGFDALAATLDPNATGKVIAAKHANLKVWQDKNQDGLCQLSEVASASRFVREIPLAYRTIQNPKLTEDNEIRLVGSYVGVDGKKHNLSDVWFKLRRHEQLSMK